MPLDHIDLHRREIGKRIFRVLQCLFGVGEAVELILGAFTTPIVKIIIVEKGAANKKVAIDSRFVALMVPITKIGDLDGVRIGARFHMVTESLHFLKILRTDDALQQTIKFGIKFHKNTFRIFSY